VVPKYNLLESDERHAGFMFSGEEMMVLLEDSVVSLPVKFPRLEYLLIERGTPLAKQACVCLRQCEGDELARLLGREVDGWRWGDWRWSPLFCAVVVKPMPYPLYSG